jgi:mannose-6-phosphate isomerase-like protein (cupin superfamily)
VPNRTLWPAASAAVDGRGGDRKETTVTLGGGYMLPSREGTQIAAIGLGITMKADGAATHDAYSLFEYTVPPETDGPPPHLHTREDESFICLAGRLDVHLGGEDFVLEHGDYLYLPRDVVTRLPQPVPTRSRASSPSSRRPAWRATTRRSRRCRPARRTSG